MSSTFYSAASSSAGPVLESIKNEILPGVRGGSASTMATALHPPLSRTSRVAQLDSSLLDAELANILSAPVLSTLSNRLRSNYAHELALLLKFALLHIALKRDGATYGAKLQNLVFATDFRTNRDTRRRWLYVLLATLPEYLHARLRDYMLVHGWPDYPAPRSAIATLANSLAGRTAARTKRELKRLAWDCLARLEKLWSFLKLANFLAFLYDARYPTILTRTLRLRYRYAQKSVSRNVSFEFLNRQLVWEAFTEFLLFLMPLIDLPALKKALSRTLHRSSVLSSLYSLLPQRFLRTFGLPPPPMKSSSNKHRRTISADGTVEDKATGPLGHLPPNICPICYSNSTQPASSLSDPSAEITDPTDPTTSTHFLASLTNTHGPKIGAGNEVYIPYRVNCCDGLYCYYCISSVLLKWERAKQELEEVQGSRRGTTPSGSGGKETGSANARAGERDEEEEEGWSCLRCGESVTGIERYTGLEGNDVGSTAEQDDGEDQYEEEEDVGARQ